MHVTHFEAGTVAGETSGPQRGQAALMGQLGQRIDLVHELGELAAAKEIANDRREGFGIDELLRGHGLDALIEQGHAFFDQALGAGQADAALIGQQFAHRAHAPAAQVVDVVEAAFAFFEAQQIFGRADQVFLGQNARVTVFEAQFLIDLVAADAAQVVAFGIEEQALDQRAGVGGGGGIAGTEAAVDILEGLFLILGGILLEALDDDAVVDGGVHHANLRHPQLGDLLDHCFRQRLESAGDNDALVLVDRVFDQDFVLNIVQVFSRSHGELLDVVKELEHIGVRAVSEGAEEGGGEKFPAALLAVEVHVEQIAGVELGFVPRAAIGNDAKGMERLAVGMLGGLEGNAGRAMQLADDHALGAVDDESPLRRHQRQFPHEHLFFLGPALVFEQERDVQRRAVGDAFTQALQPVLLWFPDLVAVVVEHDFSIVAFDGKDFGEDRLQAEILAFGSGDLGLEKLAVGIDLDFDQVRRRDDFFDFTKVNTFYYSRWHF